MRIELEHRTAFRYDRLVFLEPLDIRLRPRSDATQRLVIFELAIDPSPAGLSENEDLYGNEVARAWFEGTHERLTITTRATVETLRLDPFDALLDPEARKLPFRAHEHERLGLAPFLVREANEADVAELAASVAREVDQETFPFLAALTRRLHDGWRAIERPEGEPWPPAKTFAQRVGACRDLAVLYIDACRALGLAARFVSGYFAAEVRERRHTLHAWSEVYLPGAGWRGFDPTEGMAVTDRHVAVAAGPSPTSAAPTAGTFRGTGATSVLETVIRLEARP